MSMLSRTGVEALIQPVAVSVIAFALGYQVRSYLSSSSPLRGEWKDRSNKKRKLAPSESTAASPRAASTPIPSAGIAAGDKEGASSSGSESDGATDSDSDAEDERAAASFDLNSVTASALEEVKLVLVVNDSLKMQKGKIAAQAGHATLACALMLKDANPRLYRNWQRQGQPKIALRCATTEDLEVLAAQARSLNLCARTIQDAGRTQVAPGSKTILGIGPGPARLINTVTGKLKLL